MKKVLLIEDDATLLKVLEIIFKQQGFDIAMAKDGKEGIAMAEQQKYDLIVTDLMMPYANGLEVVDRVKRNFETKDTPIIVLTAVTTQASELESVKMGVAAYLRKPVIPKELIALALKLTSK
jgi:DNA-binding response OmpR family regulator